MLMEQYKFVLQPRSYFSAIFSSDTLFGTLCWYIRYLEGEKALEEMLENFAKEPPFLISSLLPEGFIPRPFLPFTMKNSINDINLTKKLKKLKWIPMSIFAKYQNRFSMDDIAVSEVFEQEQKLREKLMPVEITRNMINRQTGTVVEGMLFTDTYVCADAVKFVLYVTEYAETYHELLQRALECACELGLGREASTGKGLFSVRQAALDELEKKVFMQKGSHFISLSLCAGDNLVPVSYDTFTRYGKLGGEFSQHGIRGRLLFHKKPVVFYTEGSTFKANGTKNGTLLRNVHVDERICQYAFAYPLYFTPQGISH